MTTDLHAQAIDEREREQFERRLAHAGQDAPPNPYTVAHRLLYTCEQHSTATGKDLRDTIMAALVPLCKIRANRDIIATEIQRMGGKTSD